MRMHSHTSQTIGGQRWERDMTNTIKQAMVQLCTLSYPADNHVFFILYLGDFIYFLIKRCKLLSGLCDNKRDLKGWR